MTPKDSVMMTINGRSRDQRRISTGALIKKQTGEVEIDDELVPARRELVPRTKKDMTTSSVMLR